MRDINKALLVSLVLSVALTACGGGNNQSSSNATAGPGENAANAAATAAAGAANAAAGAAQNAAGAAQNAAGAAQNAAGAAKNAAGGAMHNAAAGAAGAAGAAAGAMGAAGSTASASTIFSANCSSCHGATGQGAPGSFPALANNAVVAGDPAKLIHIIKYGLTGKISVNGQSYDGQMPAWGTQLSNADIAAVTTYIRSQFGNHAGAVTEAQVAAVKQ